MAIQLQDCDWLLSQVVLGLRLSRATVVTVSLIPIVRSAGRLDSLLKKALVFQTASSILLRKLQYLIEDVNELLDSFIQAKEKPEARRRYAQGKRKKRVRHDIGKLEELSNESISNPRNVEKPRVQQNGRTRVQVSNMAAEGSDKQHSLGEGGNFQNQIDRIAGQNLNGPQNTTLYPPVQDGSGFVPLEANLESESSSSQSSGVISNLSEKIRMLFPKEPSTAEATTKRKPARTTRRENVKTKHRHNFTRIDDATLLDLSVEETRFSITDFKANEHDFTKIAMNLEESQIPSFKIDTKQFLKEQSLQNLRILAKDIRMANNSRNNLPQQFFEQPNEDQYNRIEPISQQNFMETDYEAYGAHLLQTIGSQQKRTFASVAPKQKQGKGRVFYDLLVLAQQRKIKLKQEDPSHFSQITLQAVG